MFKALVIGLATLTAMPVAAALAADHQVLMVNKDSEGRAMQFEPAFLKVAPGDTVTFVSKDKGHNSEAIPNHIPKGAEPWKGKIGQDVAVTFSTEGFYAYKCLPHAGLGMVGLIEVGEAGTPDPEMSKGIPGKGKARMEELLTQAQAQ